MSRELDSLALAEGSRLAVVDGPDGLAALLLVCEADGTWRRARPGDGAAEALLVLLAATPGVAVRSRFTVRSWISRPATGEWPITVDQTNESVIVGHAAVVKWATHLQQGPHPAPHRIEMLRANGFRHMPQPWGLITWQPDDGPETLVVNVDEFLPDAVDGWTWAVEKMVTAARDGEIEALSSAVADVGRVVAELHAALAATASTATAADTRRWRDAALATLEEARALSIPPLTEFVAQHLAEIERILEGLGSLSGGPVLDGHGDLHVGQVLRHAGGYVVTDFDGNPVLPAAERVLPIPAALDVAGMTQSLAHVAIVARRHNDLDATALAVADHAAREVFLESYAGRLAALGCAALYDPGPLRAFRLQQVLREIIYAARHLPRWMYVPNLALPALLEEGRPGEP